VAPLSVTIITRNEADNIDACLDSVAWADDVLVVDSGSTDDTVARAKAKGARVIVREWPGYAAQKNFAASQASHDWILSVDADERVTPELADEIKSTLGAGPAASGYRIPRLAFHLGRWIRTTDWYPDPQLRLYDRRRGRWRPMRVHESVEVEGPVGRLSGHLQHFTYRDLGHQVDTLNHYSTLAAEEMLAADRRPSVAHVVLHPPAAFLRNYILRRGIADGLAGFVISTMSAYYVFLKFAKLWDLSRRRDAGEGGA